MKKWCSALVGLVSLFAVVAGCRPAAAPSIPAITPQAKAPSPAAPTANLSTSASQDEWAKVVAAARREGMVNIYSYNMVADVGSRVAKAFADRYGIRAEIVTGGGAALAEKIMTEKRSGSMTADVMDTNPLQIANIKDAGATVSMDGLPVLKEQGVWRIEPWASDPDKHILLHSSIYLTSFANTNVLKPEDFPKSFAELAQPKWKGKIVTFDPAISSGPTNLFLTLLRRKFIDEETLRAIGKSNINFTPNSSEASRSLLQGQYSMDIETGNITYGSIYVSTGTPLPIRPIAMQEGTVFTSNALASIKDSPHPNAAKVFANWLLSPEGQNVFVGAQMLTPVRKDVQDFVPPFLHLEPVRAVTTTIDDDKENTRLFREKWLSNLWKQ